MRKITILLFIFAVNICLAQTNNFDYARIFTDGSCTEIKSGVEISEIKDPFFKKLVENISKPSYSEFRIQDYRPYQDPKIMAKKNKLWFCYSNRDNPTGIYASKEDEELVVFVGPTHGQEIKMVIQNLNKGFGYNKSSSFKMNNPEASLEVSVSRTMKVVRRAASYISSHSLDLKHKPLSHLDYHITQQYLHNIHLSNNYRPIVVS